MKPKVEEKDLEAALVRLDSIADDIRNQKFTFDDAATYISQDKDTKNNHGLMANKNTGTRVLKCRTWHNFSGSGQDGGKI